MTTAERLFAVAILAGIGLMATAFAVDRLGPRAQRGALADEGAAAGAAERAVERGQAAEETVGYVGVKIARTFGTSRKLDDVLLDGPAYRAGLRKGDLVERIDGEPVRPPAGSPRPDDPREPDHEPPGAEEESLYWTHFDGDLWSDVTFRVRGKGDVRVRRELKRSELLAALTRRQRALSDAYLARLAENLRRQGLQLKATQRALSEPPDWLDEAWRKHAAAARDPMDELLSGPHATPALRAVREAIDRWDHQALRAAMQEAGDVLQACATNPTTMGLPPHLHDLQTLSGLAEARRLATEGKFEAARRVAAEAAEGDGFAYSTDDVRYQQAAESLARETTTLAALAAALARTHETAVGAERRHKARFGDEPGPAASGTPATENH